MGSEEAFLACLDRFFPRDHPSLELGRGDDCAVIRPQGRLCLSSDLFLEGVHFRRGYFGPGDIGYKALAVNLSDLAGMAARPLGFNLNLMVPKGLDQAFWEELMAGMASLARTCGLALAGGDLSQAPMLGLDITVWGDVPCRYLTRQSGQPGDLLFVIGDLGLARAGLQILESGRDVDLFPAAITAHLRPSPRLAEAQQAASQDGVRSLMDLSDGLARDLPRLLAPGQGARLAIPEADLHPEVRARALALDQQPSRFAALGGEDYALLGCGQAGAVGRLQQELPGLMVIGEIRPEPGISLDGAPFVEAGFDHFSENG